MKMFQLIIFKIMNVAFGIRSDQIFEISNPEKFSAEDVVTYEFDKIIPFGINKPVRYRDPKIITPARDFENCGIKVESPDDIISASWDSVQTLPSLITEANVSEAFYGVITHDGQLILIIDFFRLLAEAKQRC